MSVHVLAPASTANLGSCFDAAAAALDIWNELTVEEGEGVEIAGEGAEELPRDGSHLALRAFAFLAPIDGHRFSFLNRIPVERGLGSSASTIALGLLAGAAVAEREVSLDELLQLGQRLEGHADNLAAALYGGVALVWYSDGGRRARRVAADMPAAAILAVPTARGNTASSRDGLPATVSHEDAAANVGAAALLGAAIVAGDPELLRDAFADRLHEQYRSAGAPLLQTVRANPPDGCLGVTLSGSGPSVVVWARRERAAEVESALRASLPDDIMVLPLRVAQEGARLA